MRNALAEVPRARAQMVAATIKTIFVQPDRAHIARQLDEVATVLRAQFPDVADQLVDAARVVIEARLRGSGEADATVPPSPISVMTRER